VAAGATRILDNLFGPQDESSLGVASCAPDGALLFHADVGFLAQSGRTLVCKSLTPTRAANCCEVQCVTNAGARSSRVIQRMRALTIGLSWWSPAVQPQRCQLAHGHDLSNRHPEIFTKRYLKFLTLVSLRR
jgi:hypothetical protein